MTEEPNPLQPYLGTIREVQIKVLEGKIEAMRQAKSRVLRRTEIPKDTREPTRDIVVVVGEEIARIIQLDIDDLQAELQKLQDIKRPGFSESVKRELEDRR